MEMPEGWKRIQADLSRFYDRCNDPGLIYPDFIIDRMKGLDLIKEMAEALEDELLFSNEISAEKAKGALKKFKEWK